MYIPLLGEFSVSFKYDMYQRCSVLKISHISKTETQKTTETRKRTYEFLYGLLPTSIRPKSEVIITSKQRSWSQCFCFPIKTIKSLANRINPFAK